MTIEDITDLQVCEAYYAASRCNELFASDYLQRDTEESDDVIYSAMKRALDDGLIAHQGRTLRHGWLTKKGMDVLDAYWDIINPIKKTKKDTL